MREEERGVRRGREWSGERRGEEGRQRRCERSEERKGVEWREEREEEGRKGGKREEERRGVEWMAKEVKRYLAVGASVEHHVVGGAVRPTQHRPVRSRYGFQQTAETQKEIRVPTRARSRAVTVATT